MLLPAENAVSCHIWELTELCYINLSHEFASFWQRLRCFGVTRGRHHASDRPPCDLECSHARTNAVPRVTIDFGDGRALPRTLAGITVISIYLPASRPIDTCPG